MFPHDPLLVVYLAPPTHNSPLCFINLLIGSGETPHKYNFYIFNKISMIPFNIYNSFNLYNS